MKLTDEQLINFMKASYQSRKENETRISAMLRGIKSVIAAEDALRLKDVTPFDVVSEKDCSEPYGEFRDVPYYSADTVSALIQERDAMKARVAKLEAFMDVLRNSLKTDRVDWEDFPENARQAFGILVRGKL